MPASVAGLDAVTPEEMVDLVHLRRARDLMDREYARPLDVSALARLLHGFPAGE